MSAKISYENWKIEHKGQILQTMRDNIYFALMEVLTWNHQLHSFFDPAQSIIQPSEDVDVKPQFEFRECYKVFSRSMTMKKV